MEKRKIPEIRFKGFSGEWEEKKLGSVADIFDGIHQTPNYTKSGVKFLSVENISTLDSDKYISIKDFKRQFKVFPEKNDVLMTRIGSVGVSNIVKSNEPLAYYVSLALLKPIDINYKYLAYNIQSEVTQENIWKKTLHVAFPKKINKNEIEKIKISTPEFTEQEKIGQLFDSIDKMIEVQTNLIEENKKLKKSLLQKMFPKKGEKFPELRLKGFSGEWKEKVLREVLKERKEEDTPSKTFPLVSFTVENGVTPKTERYEREFLVKETDKKYKVTRLNDLVYNPILAVEYIYNHRRIGGI